MQFDEPPADATRIGPDHYVTYVHRGSAAVGIYHWHPSPEGGWCVGYAAFAGRGEPDPVWQVLGDDPLTLTPSLLCRSCGSHGYITNGHWVAV